MVHRGLASLALALGLCLLLLSHSDSQFFLIHFIVLMLFYFEDRWAFMMGIVAPVAWLVLMLAWSGVPGLARSISIAFKPNSGFFMTELLTTLAIALSAALTERAPTVGGVNSADCRKTGARCLLQQ